MKRTMHALSIAAPVLGVVLSLTGCGSSPPSRFYVLRPIDVAAPAGDAQTPETKRDIVGVGPVALPKYLDRPQIVVDEGGHQLRLAEFDRWAEPLHDNFARVLAQNISRLRQSNATMLASWMRSAGVDYQLLVDVIEFDIEGDERVSLVANWSIMKATAEKGVLVVDKSSISVPIEGTDYEARVAALSQAVGHLGREIAKAIGEIKR